MSEHRYSAACNCVNCRQVRIDNLPSNIDGLVDFNDEETNKVRDAMGLVHTWFPWDGRREEDMTSCGQIYGRGKYEWIMVDNDTVVTCFECLANAHIFLGHLAS